MQHKTLPTSLLMVVGAFLGYALTLSKKLPLPSVKESCYEANKYPRSTGGPVMYLVSEGQT